MKQVESLLAGTPIGELFEVLEPCDGKLSSTVLRGERGRKAPDLPGHQSSIAALLNIVSKPSFDKGLVRHIAFIGFNLNAVQ